MYSFAVGVKGASYRPRATIKMTTAEQLAVKPLFKNRLPMKKAKRKRLLDLMRNPRGGMIFLDERIANEKVRKFSDGLTSGHCGVMIRCPPWSGAAYGPDSSPNR
jgi:hypothetical protein